jgi:hypothetical protein
VYKTYTPRILLCLFVGMCKSSMIWFRSSLVLLTDVCMWDGHLFYKLHKQSAARAKLHLHVIYIYIPGVQVYILVVFKMKHQGWGTTPQLHYGGTST